MENELTKSATIRSFIFKSKKIGDEILLPANNSRDANIWRALLTRWLNYSLITGRKYKVKRLNKSYIKITRYE